MIAKNKEPNDAQECKSVDHHRIKSGADVSSQLMTKPDERRWRNAVADGYGWWCNLILVGMSTR